MQSSTLSQPGSSSHYAMLSVDDAVALILSHTAALPAEEVPLSAACGRTLAADILAPEPQPPFRASMKDGYAVRCADCTGGAALAVASASRAGGGAPPPLPPASAAYITTGAPLPDGADAVVQVEDARPASPGAEGPRVRFSSPPSPGQDLRAVGSDVAAGQTVLRAGERLGPAELGLLASCGCARVLAHRPPRVGVLSTGDELAPPETPAGALRFGAVRDCNRAMLLAAAAEAGCSCVDLGLAGDDADGLAGRLAAARAAACDVLLTSGGVSMGDKDLVKPLLEASGKVHFGRVNMKPGKPLTFATLPGGMLVFGLPGNPVSSLVTFQLAALPCLRKMQGWPAPGLRRVRARTAQPLRLDPGRPEYHRATLENAAGGGLLARSTGGQLSSRLLSARGAAALLELPAAAGTLPAGSLVSALLVSDLSCAVELAGVERIVPQVEPPATPAGAPLLAVLTISDRASAGVYADESGPALAAVLREYVTTPVEIHTRLVPDEQPAIEAALRELAARGACLVCTTGGTGPSPRDVTPEAMAAVCEKTYPGFGEQMRAASLAAGVPTAILSRQSAGSLGRCLVVNVPGKPAAVRVCLEAVFPAIPYCIELLGGPRLEGKGAFRPKAK